MRERRTRWYQYFWIFSIMYFSLGFVNILFAWLGMICFLTPLGFALLAGNKAYCNHYCDRGQLFQLLGSRLRLSARKELPAWLRTPQIPLRFSGVFSDHVCQCDGCELSCGGRRSSAGNGDTVLAL